MASQTSLPTATAAAATTGQKRIHSLVVDTGPLINNEPALSTLLAQADQLYTIPSVLAEIKDEATRSRVHTTLLPFLKLRSPRPDSIRFITDFSRRTGDLEVLSKPDIHLLALCYELEIERNNGDWRIRKDPSQRGLNGKQPVPSAEADDSATAAAAAATSTSTLKSKDGQVPESAETTESAREETSQDHTNATDEEQCEETNAQDHPSNLAPRAQQSQTHHNTEPGEHLPSSHIQDRTLEGRLQQLDLEGPEVQDSRGSDGSNDSAHEASVEVNVEDAGEDDEDDDSDGWITPSNLKKHQAKEARGAAPAEIIQETLQAALLTSDFAMQNVALRVNLNLVSPSTLLRIKQLKTWVLRCYGCFHVTRQMDRQFCPKCGQATLTRTSSSTDANGNTRLHLKKNFQYNKRGNVYSIPKPTHGSANGKLANVGGGGKNHWGSGLILAEDQKEYARKTVEDRRTRQRDLMDEDYLPNLLSGERTGGHGRIRVGAGRNVNSKKRR